MQYTVPDNLDFALLQKYSVSGPRYTSYPTAPQFHEEFGPQQYRQSVQISNTSTEARPLSLYLHIPFCDTLCYFCGCHMQISHNREFMDRYIALMKREIDLLREVLDASRPVVQIHWGGGSPSYLEPYQIRTLAEYINKKFQISPKAEINMEIDPRGFTEDHITVMKEVGFNRCSIGIQDYNPAVQQAVNRIQSREETERVYWQMKEYGFESINVDLIYGLPYQTEQTFQETLDAVLAIQPDRIASFNFAYVPWMKKHQKLIPEESLPSGEEKLKILQLIIRECQKADYLFIGMDHFAKTDDGLSKALQSKTLWRNFQGYSTMADCDLLAIGTSGISQTHEVYAQNVKKIPEYRERLERDELCVYRGYALSRDDQIRRDVIMHLMCDFELKPAMIEQEHGIDFHDYFQEDLRRLAPFVDDGLIDMSRNDITVSNIGRLFVRNIAMSFDRYYHERKEQAPMFSRTV